MSQAPARGGLMRRWLPWVLLAAGLTVLVILLRPGDEKQYPPLDPASPAPSGTKALVDVLRELDAEVEVGERAPTAGTDTVLLLEDELDGRDQDELLDWVRAGGVLVVADPTSDITATDLQGQVDVGFLSPPLERGCQVPALRRVNRVDASGGQLFEVPPGASGCFTRDDLAWLLVEPLGQGNVVRLGGAGVLTNGQLGEEDNGLLAVSLLAPEPGTSVVVYRPAPPGLAPGEERSLGDLIATGVKTAIWQLVVAFAFLAFWRGRRLGKPVLEPVPVEIPGSELVLAVGNLLQRAKLRGQAATALADDLRRTLAGRLGLPPSTPPEQVAEIAANRSGVERERVLAALTAAPGDEAALVAAAQTVEAVRREVARTRRDQRPADDEEAVLVGSPPPKRR